MRFWGTPTLYVVWVYQWLSLTLAHVAKHDTHGVVGTNVVVGDTLVCVQRHYFIDVCMVQHATAQLQCHFGLLPRLPKPDGCRQRKGNQSGAQLVPRDSASSQARWVQTKKGNQTGAQLWPTDSAKTTSHAGTSQHQPEGYTAPTQCSLEPAKSYGCLFAGLPDVEQHADAYAFCRGASG